MTSILSSISGYFSRSLILGTFLPVTIFVVLSLLLLVPSLNADLSLAVVLEQLDTGKIVGISFLTIVISGLLYNMSIPILRLYQGYPWRGSWIGAWFSRRLPAIRKLVRPIYIERGIIPAPVPAPEPEAGAA